MDIIVSILVFVLGGGFMTHVYMHVCRKEGLARTNKNMLGFWLI